ncbi:hypothetical protein [Pararhizobium sp. LjRoot238]|uniref:hypothetical protein n=1 Tax=Pararhizobium sp. LjRoot238 TaxID=3342293 RepID=UPI003ECCF013
MSSTTKPKPSTDRLFQNKFAAEFESLTKLIEIAQSLLVDAGSDPADDKSAGLATTILTGAVEMSRRAKLSLLDMESELEHQLDGILNRIGHTEGMVEHLSQKIIGNPRIEGIIAVATRAMEADTFMTAQKLSKMALREAYEEFKEKRGIERIERDSPEWATMMQATSPQYETLETAKRDARNAQRRLAAAIRKHRKLTHCEAVAAE